MDNRLIFLLRLLPILLALNACDGKKGLEPVHTVSEIAVQPLEWEGRTVRLKGKVVQQLAIPFSSVAFYQLDDGTGQIIVQSAHGLPAKDENLFVQGVVHSKLVVGTFSLGTVVVEGNRL